MTLTRSTAGTALRSVPAAPARLPVTVVLADDRPADGLPALLSSVDGIRMAAEVATGPDAVREVLRHRPDVLILDLHLDDRAGAETIREVLRAAPDTAVLVFTGLDDNTSVRAAMRAGARGYLLKGVEDTGIVRAIFSMAAGEAIFGASVAGRMAELLARPPGPGPHGLDELTAREREILDLLAAGMSNSAIARRLNLAPKTISNNLSSIFSKLRVADRADAIARIRATPTSR